MTPRKRQLAFRLGDKFRLLRRETVFDVVEIIDDPVTGWHVIGQTPDGFTTAARIADVEFLDHFAEV